MCRRLRLSYAASSEEEILTKQLLIDKVTMKKIIVIASMVLLAAFVPQVVRADEKILSPDKSISVDLRTGKGEFGWTVSKNGKKVYSVKDIRLIVDGKTLAGQAAVKSVKQNIPRQ